MKLLLIPTLGSASEGRYQSTASSEVGWVWVTDTETGKMRACFNAGVNEAPRCSAWSKGD